MTQILDHNSIDHSKWDGYAESHQYGTIFHSRHLFSVYEKTPGLEPFALFCVSDSGNISGMLLAYYHSVSHGVLAPFSRRTVLLNAPITDDNDSLSLLLKALRRKAASRSIYFEIRNHYNLNNSLKIYEKLKFTYDQHLNILVDLSKDEDQLLEELGSRRRRQIRKGTKEGFEFRANDESARMSLYPILQEIYQRAKLPLHPQIFFESIYELPSSCYEVLGLFKGNEVVGAVLLLKHKNTVYSLFGGSREEFFQQRPNDLMFWSALLWAKAEGYSTFDWLGAGHPDKPYGVRDWKKQFGGEFVNYGRMYYYPNKVLYLIAEKAFSLYRKFLGPK